MVWPTVNGMQPAFNLPTTPTAHGLGGSHASDAQSWRVQAGWSSPKSRKPNPTRSSATHSQRLGHKAELNPSKVQRNAPSSVITPIFVLLDVPETARSEEQSVTLPVIAHIRDTDGNMVTYVMVVLSAKFKEVSIPTGTVECGEQLLECAVRELHEETCGIFSGKELLVVDSGLSYVREDRRSKWAQDFKTKVPFVQLVKANLIHIDISAFCQCTEDLRRYELRFLQARAVEWRPASQENSSIRFLTLEQMDRYQEKHVKMPTYDGEFVKEKWWCQMQQLWMHASEYLSSLSVPQLPKSGEAQLSEADLTDIFNKSVETEHY